MYRGRVGRACLCSSFSRGGVLPRGGNSGADFDTGDTRHRQPAALLSGPFSLPTPPKALLPPHRSASERHRIARLSTPMRALLRLGAPLIGFILLAVAAAPAHAAEPAATHIVQLERGVPLAEGRSLVRAAGGQVTGTVPIIHGVAARLAAGARSAVAHDDRVKAVSVNARARSQGDFIDSSR